MSQLMPDVAEGFIGTVLVESDVPLATLALHSTNQEGRFLLATLPVLNLAAPTAPAVAYFPHLADGGGYSSEFILLNPGTEVAHPGLRFFSSTGAALPLVSR